MNCPTCHRLLDSCAGGPVAPQPHDYTICAYCDTVLQFNDDMMSYRIAQDIPPSVRAEFDRFIRWKQGRMN